MLQVIAIIVAAVNAGLAMNEALTGHPAQAGISTFVAVFAILFILTEKSS